MEQHRSITSPSSDLVISGSGSVMKARRLRISVFESWKVTVVEVMRGSWSPLMMQVYCGCADHRKWRLQQLDTLFVLATKITLQDAQLTAAAAIAASAVD